MDVHGSRFAAPSATALDFQGNSQQVTVNPATIDLGTLGAATFVYSCQTSTGELPSVNLVVNRVDTTSPQLTLLPDPTAGTVDLDVELNGTFTDPGVLTQLQFSGPGVLNLVLNLVTI